MLTVIMEKKALTFHKTCIVIRIFHKKIKVMFVRVKLRDKYLLTQFFKGLERVFMNIAIHYHIK